MTVDVGDEILSININSSLVILQLAAVLSTVDPSNIKCIDIEWEPSYKNVLVIVLKALEWLMGRARGQCLALNSPIDLYELHQFSLMLATNPRIHLRELYLDLPTPYAMSLPFLMNIVSSVQACYLQASGLRDVEITQANFISQIPFDTCREIIFHSSWLTPPLLRQLPRFPSHVDGMFSPPPSP
jgi:hypothetical protein